MTRLYTNTVIVYKSTWVQEYGNAGVQAYVWQAGLRLAIRKGDFLRSVLPFCASFCAFCACLSAFCVFCFCFLRFSAFCTILLWKGEKCNGKYFVISINGQKAVSAGYAFCAGKCYARFCDNLAQLEVVVDDDGTYNGNPNKWVDVSYIKRGSDVLRVLDALRSAGFAGCKCIVSQCVSSGCFEKATELFCTIIWKHQPMHISFLLVCINGCFLHYDYWKGELSPWQSLFRWWKQMFSAHGILSCFGKTFLLIRSICISMVTDTTSTGICAKRKRLWSVTPTLRDACTIFCNPMSRSSGATVTFPHDFDNSTSP